MPGAVSQPKLSRAVYLGLRHGAPIPNEYFEWELALKTGWTLEYIRGLSMQDIEDYFQIADGKAKAGVK